MIDRTFTAALAFVMLAFGSATFAELATTSPAPQHVQLERVVITAQRIAPQLVAAHVDASDAEAVAVQ